MNKLFLRPLLVVAGFAALTIPAMAQTTDQVAVKIPFQFVASGRTLPAGEYRISRLNNLEPRELLLRSDENSSDAVIIRAETEEIRHGKVALAFTTVGDQRYLSRIETADLTYSFAAPRAETLLAALPNKGVAGSSGSN